jgi:hypothetical protein
VPLPRTKVFTTSDSGNPPRALLQQINELRPQPYQKTVKNRRVEVRIAKVGLGVLVVRTQLDFFNAPRLTKCIPLIDQVGDSAAFLSL